MSLKYRSIPTKTLAQNLSSSGTTLYLNNTLDWDDAQLSSSDFGTQAFVLLRNASNTQIELIEIDPTTVTSAAAITISKRGLGYDGTQSANTETKYNWSAFDTYVELGSDTPQMLQYLKDYIDGIAIASAPDASLTAKGIVEVATQAEVDSGDDTGSTTAPAVVSPSTIRAKMFHDYAADSVGTDSYAITITPAITAYATGQRFTFKAGTTNTGSCTLNVSGLGAKTIKKNYNEDLITNDIRANQIVEVVYDGTNMQMVSSGISADSLKTTLTEETSSGIVAGSPVFMQSDAEASKTLTVKTFISAGKLNSNEKAGAAGDPISDCTVAWLTESLFATSFTADTGASNSAYTALGRVSNDGQVSIFATKQIDGGASYRNYSTTRLSDSKFIVSYVAGSSTNKIVIVSLDASYTMTVGSATTTPTDNGELSIARLSDSSFIAGYVTPSADFDATVAAATVSGTTPTFGSGVTVDTTQSNNVYVIGLSSTSAIVSWGISGSAKVQQVGVSGTVCTLGASSYNVSAVQEPAYIVALSSTKFAIAYNDSATTGNVKARLASVAADVITLGTAITVDTFNHSTYGAKGIAAFGTDFVVAYQYENAGLSSATRFGYVKVSGTTATLGNNIQISDLGVFSGQNIPHPIGTVNGFVLVVTDDNFSDYVTYRTFQPVLNEVYMGVAQAAPSSSIVTTIMKGRTGGIFSGLTFGKRYLFNQDATISETGVIPAGTAISTTEILLD